VTGRRGSLAGLGPVVELGHELQSVMASGGNMAAIVTAAEQCNVALCRWQKQVEMWWITTKRVSPGTPDHWQTSDVALNS